jgi:hypothetical protein
MVTFGFFGSMIYYEGIGIPFLGKILLHVFGVVLVVWTFRAALGKVFVETGFNILPRHLVGREVEAAATINDGFGEVRTDTEMGLRRFHARPFIKGNEYKRGDDLWVISADEKYVYVDKSKDIKKWASEQTKSVSEQ